MTIPRRQINIKMSEELIEALKDKASSEGVTFTDLVNQACEKLVGIESSKPTILSVEKLDEIITEKLTPIEERLAALERRVTRSLSMGR